MFQRIAALCVLLVFLLASLRPASAINRRWDDDSNSASKLWSDADNWNPTGTPDGDHLFIGMFISAIGTPGPSSNLAKDDVTLMDQEYILESLTLGNGADIINSADGGTTGFTLQVNGNVSVSSGLSASDSIITLYDTPGHGGVSLSAGTMTISSKGRLRLDSVSAASPRLAILDVTDGLLDNSGGTSGGISGNGLIRLKDSLGGIPVTLLRNDSIISAGYINSFTFGTPPPATTLQITATSPKARFDWDGAFGAGTLQVNGNATLDIDVQPGNGIQFDPFDGTMSLSTGSTIDIAHLWTFGKLGPSGNGVINVNTQTFAITPIGQDPTPGPAAHITGSNWNMANGTINIGDTWDTLVFDSAVNATGGTIENSGMMIFNANATFGSGVDFNMNDDGASLVVNAAVSIATPDFNLDGAGQSTNVTTINSGGKLTLNLASFADDDFNHTINLNGGQLEVSTMDGEWNLENNGEINVAGGELSYINIDTITDTVLIKGDIDVTANSTLEIATGSFHESSSSVDIDAGSKLDLIHGTFDGGSYTGNGTFVIRGSTINGPTTWDVATVDFDGGAAIVNADLTINADAIDELPGDGFGNLIIIDDLAKLTVSTTGGEWTVDAPGSITFNGDNFTRTFLAGSKLNLNGTLEINGSGRTLADLNIGSTGVVNINDSGRKLQLQGDTTVAAGAVFSGDGFLLNHNGKTLRLLDGADVDVLIQNAGTLALGNSPGQVSGLSYQQTTNGTWDLEVGGTALNDFDHMTLSGEAFLNGTLDLSLIMGFTPSLGDTFSILTAAGGVFGGFDSILQPGAMPSGLVFDANYFGTIVQLEVVNAPFAGDYNQNGIVDAADYTVWLDSLGQSGIELVADGDGDGIVNQGDYDVWKANFGTSAPVSVAAANVPEPSTLLLVGLATSLGLLVPRRKRAL